MNELSDLDRAEITCLCRAFKAEARAYCWRNGCWVAIAVVAVLLTVLAWPWLRGFAELAQIWIRRMT